MKNIRFTFLVDSSERQKIREISERLQRSQGASLRFILSLWMQNSDKELERAVGRVVRKIED